MNIEVLIYSIFSIVILILLITIIILILNNSEYSTKFYNYKIKYDVDLDKYYSMLKKQKRVIRKKKLELLYLKILVRLRCR